MAVINPFGEPRYPTKEVKTTVEWHGGSRPDVSDMGSGRVFREEYEGRFEAETVREEHEKPRLKAAPARYSIDKYTAMKMSDHRVGSSQFHIQAEIERNAMASISRMVNPVCLSCHAMKFEAYQVASTNQEVFSMNCEYGKRAVCPDEAKAEMRFTDWDKVPPITDTDWDGGPLVRNRSEVRMKKEVVKEVAEVKPQATDDIRSDFGSW